MPHIRSIKEKNERPSDRPKSFLAGNILLSKYMCIDLTLYSLIYS